MVFQILFQTVQKVLAKFLQQHLLLQKMIRGFPDKETQTLAGVRHIQTRNLGCQRKTGVASTTFFFRRIFPQITTMVFCLCFLSLKAVLLYRAATGKVLNQGFQPKVALVGLFLESLKKTLT